VFIKSLSFCHGRLEVILFTGALEWWVVLHGVWVSGFYSLLQTLVLRTWFLLLVASSCGHVCSSPLKPTLVVDQKRWPVAEASFQRALIGNIGTTVSKNKETQPNKNLQTQPENLSKGMNSQWVSCWVGNVSYSFLEKWDIYKAHGGKISWMVAILHVCQDLQKNNNYCENKFPCRMLNKET